MSTEEGACKAETSSVEKTKSARSDSISCCFGGANKMKRFWPQMAALAAARRRQLLVGRHYKRHQIAVVRHGWKRTQLQASELAQAALILSIQHKKSSNGKPDRASVFKPVSGQIFTSSSSKRLAASENVDKFDADLGATSNPADVSQRRGAPDDSSHGGRQWYDQTGRRRQTGRTGWNSMAWAATGQYIQA